MKLAHAYNELMNDPLASFVVFSRLNNGEIDIVPFSSLEYRHNATIQIFPGSFNPLHDAHRSIFDAVCPPRFFPPSPSYLYEISICRYGKSDLDLPEIEKRLKQFQNYACVWLTRASLFIEKIGLMPTVNPHFHIGIDTATRLIKAHGPVAVQGLRAKFYVYPRANKDNKVEHIHDVVNPVPVNFLHADHPRPDLIGLSSTQIRSNLPH